MCKIISLHKSLLKGKEKETQTGQVSSALPHSVVLKLCPMALPSNKK